MRIHKLLQFCIKNNLRFFVHPEYDSFIDFKKKRIYWHYSGPIEIHPIRYKGNYFEFKMGGHWYKLDRSNFESKEIMEAYERYKKRE